MPHSEESTTLDILKPLMQRGTDIPARMSFDSWKAHEEIRAAKVALYRQYADGEHDVTLSDEMKDALRVKEGDVFSLNHCENIIETLADRLKVSGLRVSVSDDAGEPNEEATKAANQWVEQLLMMNGFDGLQINVHTDAIRDGTDFILVEYDADLDRVVWHHEPAFDGHSGMIAVYGSDSTDPTMCIKIWHEMQVDDNSKLVDRVRVNLYFDDRVEKYIYEDTELNEYRDENGDSSYDWKVNGEGIGVAVVPFSYKRRTYDRHGVGRLDDVIPVQRALNRTLVSLIGVAENIGFPIRYSLGADVPTTIKPGTFITVKPPSKKKLPGGGEVDLTPDEISKVLEQITKMRIGQLEAADMTHLLNLKRDLMEDMYVISGTPFPEGAGSNMSGEALKQLDIRLVGTAERNQVSFGGSWQRLIKISARAEQAFGEDVPFDDEALIKSEWESAEVRDDATTIGNVEKTTKIVPELDVQTRLEMLAPIHGWDPKRVKEIVDRVEEAANNALERELGMGRFDNFNNFGQGVSDAEAESSDSAMRS